VEELKTKKKRKIHLNEQCYAWNAVIGQGISDATLAGVVLNVWKWDTRAGVGIHARKSQLQEFG
jgi:hypothetical protein